MYPQSIQHALDKAHARVGDRIRVERNGHAYEGLLMPKTDMGDPETIILKLDSGYNVGIRLPDGAAIQKSHSKEPAEILEEEKFELRKFEPGKLKFDATKPPVSLIATGGTIASMVDYRTGGVYAAIKPEELLYNIPELADLVNVSSMSSPFSIMSEDMMPAGWVEIAKIAAKELNTESRGVVITHGTDTLHYTSAALSFMLRNLSKPVALVGAQRSSDRGSSDAWMNVICAAHASISDIAEVGTCMHGEMGDTFCLFIRGTKARKMHSIRRDAFRPINEKPLAKIWPTGKVEVLNPNHRARSDGEVELDNRIDMHVAMLKAYPNSDPKVIDYLVSEGYRGFVIETTGLGHVPTFNSRSWIETIRKHAKDGIPFVTAVQTVYGLVNPSVYTPLRVLYHEAGAIPGHDMLAETAYAKLCWVLGHTKDMDEVKKMMLTNYAGEMNARLSPDDFLI